MAAGEFQQPSNELRRLPDNRSRSSIIDNGPMLSEAAMEGWKAPVCSIGTNITLFL